MKVKQYKVIRVYLVDAENLNEAIEKVRADSATYLESEFAKEADTKDNGWGGTLKRQLFGAKR
jgi:hypothetical protein